MFPPLLPVLLLSVLVLLTASSCTSLRVSPISVTLSAADSLMMTDPQSALDTLLTADRLTVSGLCGRDAAYYGLLMAEARYKCYLPVSEDTSVFFSSEYYRRHGPDSLYARALMMCGAVHAENGDPSSALEKYKAAEPVMEAVGDYEQLGLLQTRIGELYQLTYSDVSRAVYYYRLALSSFDRCGAECRLAAANLSLSRMLLVDSAVTGTSYYRRGMEKALRDNDTGYILEGLNQKSLYLLSVSRDSLSAARVSSQVLEEKGYIKFMSRALLNTFCMIAAEGYAGCGMPDSALLYVSRIIPENTADSIMYNRVISGVERASGSEEYHKYDAAALRQLYRLKEYSDYINLESVEHAHEKELSLLNAKYRKTRLICLLMFLALSAAILTVITVVQQGKILRIRSSIRSSIQLLRSTIPWADKDRVKNQGEEEDTLSLLIERMLEETGSGLSGLSEITSVLLRISDKLLTSYEKNKNADAFRIQCGELIRANFDRDKFPYMMMRLVNTVYPGFLEGIQSQSPSLTERELCIISMLVCGFSNTSISVITGNKCSSVMVDKSRIAAKIGVKEKLSSYISTRLKDFT